MKGIVAFFGQSGAVWNGPCSTKGDVAIGSRRGEDMHMTGTPGTPRGLNRFYLALWPPLLACLLAAPAWADMPRNPSDPAWCRVCHREAVFLAEPVSPWAHAEVSCRECRQN